MLHSGTTPSRRKYTAVGARASARVMPPPNTRCDFEYTVAAGANDAAKRNALTGEAEGQLLVAADHWFAAVMGHMCWLRRLQWLVLP